MKNSKDIKNTSKELNNHLSFNSFVDYLRDIHEKEEGLRKQYLNETIRLYTAQKPNVEVDLSYNDTINKLFELTDQTIFFGLDKENNSFNIYTTPDWDEILYVKNDLKGILQPKNERESFIKCVTDLLSKTELLAALCYRTIWHHLVDFPCTLAGSNIISYQSIETGQSFYFELNPDFQFILLQTKLSENVYKEAIEEIDAIVISEEDTLLKLISKLPLDDFEFSGFGKITVTDITVSHITKLIDRQVDSSDHYAKTFSYLKDTREALKIVAGNNKLRFGLLPMFELNGQFTFSGNFSDLELTGSFGKAAQDNLFDYLNNVYKLKPYRLYLKEITDDLAEKYEYLKVHKHNGIQSFAFLPIFYHGRFVGVLEVVAQNPDDLSKTILSKLETFFPVLSAIFNKSIENLRQNMEEVLKTKFTSLQPSVQWRFNQAAYQYLQTAKNQETSTEIGDIEFNQVYPLYGAIDIKNSTVNRNHALRQDAVFHLNLLNETFALLKACTAFGLLEEKISDCKRWMDLVSNESVELPEGELDYFFENDIYCFLKELTAGKPEVTEITDTYFIAVNDANGPISAQRRMLESSMNKTIATINDLVDDLNIKAQQDYPCFFEKFRTDGVEYDIYAGQSIAPDRPFKHIFIKNIRLLQLNNMITIANRVKELQPQLPLSVEITQLIFVNPNFIDISFRRDERRFDVEGAYNIRYHIVKKRIDKVLIKNTTERLTAPGKIAIVYTNQKEADEYMIHIKYLQSQYLLKDETEFLELEQLQGVIGLKAIRIAIHYQ